MTKNRSFMGAGFLFMMSLFIIGCTSAPDRITEDPKRPIQPEADLNNTSGKAAELNPLGAVVLPEESRTFWSEIMTPEIIDRYKAQGYKTFCNLFMGDTLRNHFGGETFSKIFPDGVLDPNAMHEQWKSNPYMVRLGPDKYTIGDIQKLADEGYLIVLSYTWIYGHLAFVANKNMKIQTVPPSPMIDGKMGPDLDKMFLPLVAQAGTYTGITSAGYASNGWIDSPGYPLFQNGTVRFYLVRQ